MSHFDDALGINSTAGSPPYQQHHHQQPPPQQQQQQQQLPPHHQQQHQQQPQHYHQQQQQQQPPPQGTFELDLDAQLAPSVRRPPAGFAGLALNTSTDPYSSASSAGGNSTDESSEEKIPSPSTRVSPRSRDRGEGFNFGRTETHPFDQGPEGGTVPPRARRRSHRKAISFSDEPGSLETTSLAAMLNQAPSQAATGSGGSPNGGASKPNLKELMLTATGYGGRRASNSMSGIDLIDLLEGGEARECLSDDVVGTPHGADGEDRWQHAIVEVDEDKLMFRLFLEAGHKFLLSARRVDDDFYISQYFDFPEEYDRAEGDYSDRFCGVVRKSNRCYRVWNRGCEICDNELAKYRCGLDDSKTQRQELAVVRHQESKVMDGDRVIADARQILIDIPTLDAEALRQGWCERFPRKPSTSMPLASLLPDWNPRIQSLSMKFLHSRVKAASSKNFLVSGLNSMDEEHSCLQFGKVKSGIFNLSYRSPVAAIQAFGVSLSLYNWLGQSAKKQKKRSIKKKKHR